MTVLQQLRYLGTPADKLAAIERDFARLEAGDATPNILGAPGAYWNELAKKLRKPLLVLRGVRRLERRARHGPGGQPAEYSVPRHVSGEVIVRVAAFVAK